MKFHYVLVAAMLLMLTSCVNKDRLPENPKDKQTHIDSNGNRWIYDYAAMRWMMSSTAGANYYYYPRSDKWTTSTGATVAKPAVTKVNTSRPVNTGKSFGSSHPTSVRS